MASPTTAATDTKDVYPSAGPSWQLSPPQTLAPPATEAHSSGAGIYIAIGLVGAIIFVLTACTVAVMMIRHHRRQARARRLARRQAQQQPEELIEGDPGEVRIPVIVILPDNRLHFGWELRPDDLGGCGLERCPSEIFKDSQDGSEAGGEGLLLEGEGPAGPATPGRRVRIRPPLVSAHVPIIDIPVIEEKC